MSAMEAARTLVKLMNKDDCENELFWRGFTLRNPLGLAGVCRYCGEQVVGNCSAVDDPFEFMTFCAVHIPKCRRNALAALIAAELSTSNPTNDSDAVNTNV